MSTNSNSMRYESINQADVPKGRGGKHKTIVTAILNDLDLLDPDRALRISLAQLPGSKEDIRSALNRATPQHGTEVSISSDSEYLYVWKTTRALSDHSA